MPLLPLLARFAQGGPPAGMHGPPPGFSIPAGVTGGPPPEILSMIQKAAATATETVASSVLTGAASGVTGPPAGFPAGMTGPPPGITGFPAGMTGPPASIPTGGVASGFNGKGPPKKITQHDSNTMIGVTTVLLVLCISAVGGRLISRRMVRQNIGADDWTAVASLLLFIALAINEYCIAVLNTQLTIATAPISFGRFKLSSTLLYFFCITAARISVLLLFKRVFNFRVKWFKVAWWFCMVLTLSYCFAYVVMNLAQCSPHPLSSVWTKPWLCKDQPGSATAGGFLNAAIDTTLLILPIRMVWTLQMTKRQKVAISGVFALGFM